MKLKKLNRRGFTHGMVMMAFVVIFAIAGVGYIVAGHAQSKHGPNKSSKAKVSSSGVSTKSGDKAKGSTKLRGKAKLVAVGKGLAPQYCMNISLTNKSKPGVCIKYMQTLLNDSGMSPLVKVNGVYSSKTTAAVSAFQSGFKSRNPSVDMPVDGTAGLQTWRKLCATSLNRQNLRLDPKYLADKGAPTAQPVLDAYVAAGCQVLHDALSPQVQTQERAFVVPAPGLTP